MKQMLKRHSIMKRITLSLAVVFILQSFLFAGLIWFGGTVTQLNQNALDILNERVINRKNDLENEMIQRWSSLSQSQEIIHDTVLAYLSETEQDYTSLVPEDEQTAELLANLSDELIYLLRRNIVTGAFVVFDGPPESQNKTGLYLRDMDPTSNPSNNSDLLLERGPATLGQLLNIPMDTGWTPTFYMDTPHPFYDLPLHAAAQYPGVKASDLGFWSAPFQLSTDDRMLITYTQPLLDDSGKSYGVIGVEIALDYLQSQVPYTELNPEKNSGYLLAMTEDNGRTFHRVMVSGPILKALFGETDTFSFEKSSQYNSIFTAETDPNRTSEEVYASVQYINLYNSNTPFVHQRWALIGLSRGSDLFAFSNNVVSTLLTFSLASLLLGVAFACFAGYVVSKPIQTLVEEVRTLDPSHPVKLSPTHVSEIDDLSGAIELLSQNVAEAASRLSQIIEMTSIPIGAFEINRATLQVYVTKGFLTMFGLSADQEPTTKEELDAIFEEKRTYIEEEDMNTLTVVYKHPDGANNFRWLRLKAVVADASILGVMVDVTSEILEKHKIEYERDYDLLTNLLNRRAFLARLKRLEQHPEQLKTGALIMMDLDNLKYINDTYGHDYGDEYIRCAAEVLRKCSVYNALAARMSGDEFFMFFSGYDSKEDLKQVIGQMRLKMDETYMLLPDGHKFKLRASAGIAWYPDDSRSFEELIRYADFAMYEVKNAVKGGVKDFDLGSYQRDAFLLYSREELNRIIDEQATDFVFQPIVSCATGEVIGHEALMRPRSKALTTPADVLRIARAQSKLYQIERLTWFKAMEIYAALPDKPQDGLIFINSIPSQALTIEDCAAFDQLYADYLGRYVIELTEADELDEQGTMYKQSRVGRHGAHIAIDDFGTGYNNDALLLNLKPDYVKVDMGIVRGIHHDANRRELFRNLATFCRERGIQVIAEGVETQEEMEVVVALGADLIQGYFAAKPQRLLMPVPAERAAAIRAAYAKFRLHSK